MKAQERDDLLKALRLRFEKNATRHKGLTWNTIQTRLESTPRALDVLAQMESTGGEPDVIGYDKTADQYVFCDCSAESPTGRRSLCFDGNALASRKDNKPKGSALGAAASSVSNS